MKWNYATRLICASELALLARMVGAALRPVHVLPLVLCCVSQLLPAAAAAEPRPDAAKRAPILRAALPPFAAPGQKVMVRGANLEGVTELRVGDRAVETSSITKTAITFVVPDGLQSGTLSVRSPGGDASLRVPFGVYYKPVVAKVTPNRFGPGAVLQVEGTHLDAGMTVKIGPTPIKTIKQGPAGLELHLPANMMRGGTLTLRWRGRPELRVEGLVFVGAPKLLTGGPLSAKPGDTVTLRGRNLDAIDELRVGEQKVEPSARSAAALSFVVSEGLSGGVIAVSGAGGSASLGKPLVVQAASGAGTGTGAASKSGKVDAGAVLAVRYAPSGNGASGEIRGQGFEKDTRFLLDGQAIESAVVDAEQATFTLAKMPGRGEHALVAARGESKSSAYRFDAAAGGYYFAGDRLARMLSGAIKGYDLAPIRLDLDQSAVVFAAPAGAGAAKVASTASKTKSRLAVQEAALAVAVELERMTVAQRALCAAMAPGKDNAKSNAYAGDLLARATQQTRKLIGEGLGRLWPGLPPQVWTDSMMAGETGIAAVDDKLAAVLAARACEQLARASETVDANAERDYVALVEAAIGQVSAAAASPAEGAEQVKQAISAFSAARRDYWMQQLSALTQRVQDGAKVTGKGARTGKKAEKVGK